MGRVWPCCVAHSHRRTAPGTAFVVTSPVASTTQRISLRQSLIEAKAAEATLPEWPPKMSCAAAEGNCTARCELGFPQQQPAEKQPSRPKALPSETVGRPMSDRRKK